MGLTEHPLPTFQAANSGNQQIVPISVPNNAILVAQNGGNVGAGQAPLNPQFVQVHSPPPGFKQQGLPTPRPRPGAQRPNGQRPGPTRRPRPKPFRNPLGLNLGVLGKLLGLKSDKRYKRLSGYSDSSQSGSDASSECSSDYSSLSYTGGWAVGTGPGAGPSPYQTMEQTFVNPDQMYY